MESHVHSYHNMNLLSDINKHVGIMYERAQYLTHGHGKNCSEVHKWYGKERLALRPEKADQITSNVYASCGNQFGKGRRSRSGTLIMHDDEILAATTILQSCISLSSTSVEYVALAEAVKRIIWLKSVLKGL